MLSAMFFHFFFWVSMFFAKTLFTTTLFLLCLTTNLIILNGKGFSFWVSLMICLIYLGGLLVILLYISSINKNQSEGLWSSGLILVFLAPLSFFWKSTSFSENLSFLSFFNLMFVLTILTFLIYLLYMLTNLLKGFKAPSRLLI